MLLSHSIVERSITISVFQSDIGIESNQLRYQLHVAFAGGHMQHRPPIFICSIEPRMVAVGGRRGQMRRQWWV